MKKVVFFLLVFFCLSYVAYAKQITVCPDKGSDGCDYTSIQAAINAAANGDEIYIKKGVYSEEDINITNKDLTIKGESANSTIINPVAGRGIYICCAADYWSKTKTCNVNLYNLQIRGGSVDYGGGIYGKSDYATLNVSMHQLYVVGNSASSDGGGIYFTSGANGHWVVSDFNLEIINSNIDRNVASGNGGGLYFKGNGVVTIKNTTIQSNTASGMGGGIYNQDSTTLIISDSYIKGNTSLAKGGGTYHKSSKEVVITKCTIENNSADVGGGGIFNEGSGVLKVNNSNIQGNSGGYSGGIASYGTLKVTSCVIKSNNSTGNSTEGTGGGIGFGGEATITKSWIIDNSANSEGGGIDLWDETKTTLYLYSSVVAFNRASTKGGAMCLGSECHDKNGDSVVTIKSSTIYGNSAPTAKGVFVASGYSEAPMTLQILDTVFANEGDDLLFERDENENTYGNFVIRSNVFSADVDLPTTNITSGENRIITDLGFANPDEYDFSLLENSPLIDLDTGATAYLEDIAGSYRDEKADIGACEYPSKCSLADLQPGSPGAPQFETDIEGGTKFLEKTAIISFKIGWNLCGIPSVDDKTIKSVFGENLGSVYTLWKWDSSYGTWKLYTSNEDIKNYLQGLPTTIELLNENATLSPGEGFWVKATSSFNIEYKAYEKVEE